MGKELFAAGQPIGNLQNGPEEKLGISNFLHVQDRKNAGTHGGTFTAGAWRTRELNTICTNTIVGASLADNQVTLPAGKYFIEASAQAYYQVGVHSLVLYDITNASIIIQGRTSQVGSSSTTASVNDLIFVSGSFELTSDSVLELQHKCNTTCATYGFGVNSDVGQLYGIFGEIKLWKVS